MSIRDEMPMSVFSRLSSAAVRSVKTAVTPSLLRKSIRRVSMERTCFCSPTVIRFESGSITTTCGLKARTTLWMLTRWSSRPHMVGRAAWKASRQSRTHRSRSSPTERMFLMIWASDSSNEKYRTRSPRRQAASAKWAAMVDLPMPAVPETRTELPRKTPSPPSIASRRGIPVEIRSSDAAFSRVAEVIGMTEKPSASIRKGYSSMPWVVPRYFTIRSRRVVTSL